MVLALDRRRQPEAGKSVRRLKAPANSCQPCKSAFEKHRAPEIGAPVDPLVPAA